jgi:hypothetical protein
MQELTWVIGLLDTYENERDESWVVMGFALHHMVDVIGHLGVPVAYLLLEIPLHYLTELTVCSALRKERRPICRIRPSALSDSIYDKGVHSDSFKFGCIYRAR